MAVHLTQQHGYFHGALIGAAMDSAGGYAALSLLPAGSEVIARGQVIRPGRTITVTEVRAYCVREDASHLTAVMLQSVIRIVPR
jgi:acyl-coenzyme A thioesterase PaaI-like protein